MTGFGTYCFADGDIYQGSYVNGIKSGSGVYAFADGDAYEGCSFRRDTFILWIIDFCIGDYENDKQHGTGTYITASGAKYTGSYYFGKMHGKGLYQ